MSTTQSNGQWAKIFAPILRVYSEHPTATMEDGSPVKILKLADENAARKLGIEADAMGSISVYGVRVISECDSSVWSVIDEKEKVTFQDKFGKQWTLETVVIDRAPAVEFGTRLNRNNGTVVEPVSVGCSLHFSSKGVGAEYAARPDSWMTPDPFAKTVYHRRDDFAFGQYEVVDMVDTIIQPNDDSSFFAGVTRRTATIKLKDPSPSLDSLQSAVANRLVEGIKCILAGDSLVPYTEGWVAKESGLDDFLPMETSSAKDASLQGLAHLPLTVGVAEEGEFIKDGYSGFVSITAQREYLEKRGIAGS